MQQFNFVRFDHRHHLEPVYHWMNDPKEQQMFLTHSASNSLRDFEGWIQDRLKFFYHEFFVVESQEHEPVGIAYSYEQHVIDGHCKMAVYISPKWRGSAGAMVGLQMLDYLFCYYPFRQVFCDVYRYNNSCLSGLAQCGFQEMGVISGYRYLNGAYHDLILLTMPRESFYQKWGKMFPLESKL